MASTGEDAYAPIQLNANPRRARLTTAPKFATSYYARANAKVKNDKNQIGREGKPRLTENRYQYMPHERRPTFHRQSRRKSVT